MRNLKTTDNFDPYDFSLKEIDGVPVYYKTFPTSPCVHIRVCFNTGSLHDPTGLEGLSHFLEHMIFDGSPKLPNKKVIKEWSKINALNSWNAWTWFTNTNYHLRCLPSNLDKALSGMKDMIFYPLLRNKDIKHEMSVITQEAWGRYKNEKYLKYTKEILNNVFHGTQRERIWSPLGWPETILKIKQKDVFNWHKDNYGKGNFFIVVAGCIQDSDLKKIEKFLKNIPIAKINNNEFGKLSKPKTNLIKKNSVDIGDPKEQVEISFERTMESYKCPSPEIIVMANSLLADILFERMRTEKALCYKVNVFSDLQKDFYQFGVNINAKEENTKIILDEFSKTIKDIVLGKEVKRFNVLKKVNLDKIKSSEDVTGEVANYVLSDIWKYSKIRTLKELIKESKKVTYKNVSDFISKAFNKDWLVTEIITPNK